MLSKLKIKVIIVAVLITFMCNGTVSVFAGVMTGLGEINLTSKAVVIAMTNKTTSAGYSYLSIGDVAIYDSINATTYSQQPSGKFYQSNPWTQCMENSTTYLGQYVSVYSYVGQGIKLYAKRSSNASTSHAAEFVSWDYQ